LQGYGHVRPAGLIGHQETLDLLFYRAIRRSDLKLVTRIPLGDEGGLLGPAIRTEQLRTIPRQLAGQHAAAPANP